MFDLHNLLNKVVNWVNSIGESKVIQHPNNHEVISAIKVKKPKPVEEYKESPWVKNENKEPKSNNTVTGSTQNKTHVLDPYYVDMRGTSSTSMYYKTDDEYLDEILSDGYNIKPVDITPGHRNTPPRYTNLGHRNAPPPPPPYSHSLMGKPGIPGVSGSQPKKSKKKAK
jgi:hypothetical protein